MAITRVGGNNVEFGPGGDALLASGATMAMRLWKNEEPQEKPHHRSAYETLGYVISGRADLTIEGETVDLMPGDSYVVPANAEHSYRIFEPFTAVECVSPPPSTKG